MASEETESQLPRIVESTVEIPNGGAEAALETTEGRGEKKLSNAEIIKFSTVEVQPELKDDLITKMLKPVREFTKRNRKWVVRVMKALVFVAYNVYLGFAIYLTWNDPPMWDKGVRSLVLFTAFVYFMMLYYLCIKKYVVKPALTGCYSIKCVNTALNWKYFPWLVWVCITTGILIFLVIDSAKNRYRLLSFFGLFILIFLGYVFSAHRRHVVWRQTLWGCLLQFGFGCVVLRWDVGRLFLNTLGSKVDTFLGYTDMGSKFVFGYLAEGDLSRDDRTAAIFAFKIFPVILFFSFFTSILYYYGLMQSIIIKIGWFLQKTIRTTACESVTASANIFLGLTETPLLIKPFITVMTKSEIHAVMTGGYATIAGGVMAAYINFGISPTHLLSASVMSAPAALSYAKLFYPETEESKTSINHIKVEKGSEKNVIEAAINGVNAAVEMTVSMAANMIAFLAFVNFLNGSISWLTCLLGVDYIDFNWLMGKCFLPVSLIMGVEWEDAEVVANLVGIKTIVNEFLAYKKLADLKKNKMISQRSEFIATYALCGFSNISAIGVQMGGLVAIAGNRKSDFSDVAVRALIAGAASCFMTACIAGCLI